MALIKCIDCGNEVSSYAEACPKCGCPIQRSLDFAKEYDRSSDLYDVKVISIADGHVNWIRGVIQQLWNVSADNAEAVIDQIPFVIARGANRSTADEIEKLLKKWVILMTFSRTSAGGICIYIRKAKIGFYMRRKLPV